MTISEINDWSWDALESSLLPVEADLPVKVATYAYQFFKFILCVPLCAVTSTLNLIASRFSKKIDDPLVEFAKRPTWHPLGPKDAAPVEVGFATAGFQDDGPAGHPDTNWSRYHANSDLGLVPDFWNHPERYVEALHGTGVRHIRFSIDRDRVQSADGQINQVALARYREIIQLFKANEIEPMITLVHFCDPINFSWARAEDIPGLVEYAAVVCDMLAEEGVQKIVTINEPTVVAFQGWVMGKFPPLHKLDFQTAAKVLENMMRAHTLIYQRVKQAHPELQIGISHDPIRFRNYHKWNPLWSPIERLICHYLTEINHSALMRYFETGHFSLKVPFRANHSFTTEKPPLDFLGIQYYSDPLLELSFKGGASVSRVEGEPIATYQFRMYPQGIASALFEASKVGVPIEITELGMDTGIPENLRIQYFARVFQSIQKALDHGVNVRSCYFWTPIRNIEWYKEWEVDFGFHDFNHETGEITRRPICDWLQGQSERYYQNREAAAAG